MAGSFNKIGQNVHNLEELYQYIFGLFHVLVNSMEVWEWICDFNPHFIMDVINYLCLRLIMMKSFI